MKNMTDPMDWRVGTGVNRNTHTLARTRTYMHPHTEWWKEHIRIQLMCFELALSETPTWDLNNEVHP